MRKRYHFVPKLHPLRSIRVMANEALAKVERLFAGMYEADIEGGRPSIAPEKFLRIMLIQILYSVRSERQLSEQVQYKLLFRWFIGLSMDDEVCVPTVFTKTSPGAYLKVWEQSRPRINADFIGFARKALAFRPGMDSAARKACPSPAC